MPRLRRHLRADPPDERVVRALPVPPGPRRHGEAAVHGRGRRQGWLLGAGGAGRRWLLRRCPRPRLAPPAGFAFPPLPGRLRRPRAPPPAPPAPFPSPPCPF